MNELKKALAAMQSHKRLFAKSELIALKFERKMNYLASLEKYIEIQDEKPGVESYLLHSKQAIIHDMDETKKLLLRLILRYDKEVSKIKFFYHE